MGEPVGAQDAVGRSRRKRTGCSASPRRGSKEPEEPRRRKVLSAGTIGDPKSPATWVALAAGWSGGSVVPEEMGYAPADPEQTAKAVRVALFIALSRLEAEGKTRSNDGVPS